MGSTGMASGSQFVSGAVIAGKYRLLKPLGEGAMGAVWAAQNEATFAQVALKLIVRPGQELRQRLLREARACGTIRHRNVVQIYDIGETAEGDPFLVMELLQGEPLSDLLARKRRLSVEDAARIGRDIARGLAAAHEKGIVHRDLKPANVFLHNEPGEEAPVVKVLDFGVSKNLGVNDGLSTVAGGTVGSPMYMSPEQANAERDVDARTDLWSLGVLLFEMLVGERPFSGESSAVMLAIREGEIPTVSRRLRRIDPGLDRVVSGCLTRSRDARLGPAADVARLLEPFAGQQPGPVGRAPLPSLMDMEAAAEAASALSASGSGPGVLTRSGGRDDAPRSSAPSLAPDRAPSSGQGSGGSALVDEDEESSTRPIAAHMLAPRAQAAPPSRPSAAPAPVEAPYGVTEHGTVRIAPEELETALRLREQQQAASTGLNPRGGTVPMLPVPPALQPLSAGASSTAPMLTSAAPPAPPPPPPAFVAPSRPPRRAARPVLVVGAGAALGASFVALAAFLLLRRPPAPTADPAPSATASAPPPASSSATGVSPEPPAPSVTAAPAPPSAAPTMSASTGATEPPAPTPTTTAPPKSAVPPKATTPTKPVSPKPASTATTTKSTSTTKTTSTKQQCGKFGLPCK